MDPRTETSRLVLVSSEPDELCTSPALPDARHATSACLDDDLDWHALLLAAGIRQERGDPREWRAAPRRAGLASSVIDAIMTPRVTSVTVENAVTRFVDRFGDGDLDVLRGAMDELGAERWRTEVLTSHRVVLRKDAPYKADVIAEAAEVLRHYDVWAADHLVERARDEVLRGAWCAVTGQSSGFTWRHLLLAAGLDDPLVCPLTRRFVRRHLGRPAAAAPETELLAVMTRAACLLGVDTLELDHQLWRAALTPPPHRGVSQGGAESDGVSREETSDGATQASNDGADAGNEQEAEAREASDGLLVAHPVGLDLGAGGRGAGR